MINTRLVFVDEVQVQSEEQQIKRKEVCDLADASFHKLDLSVLQILDFGRFLELNYTTG